MPKFHKDSTFNTFVFSTLIILMSLVKVEAHETNKRGNIMKAATYIPLTAKSGQSQNLTVFLQKGAELVTQTEPNTLYWYALKSEDGSLAIFDFFPNEDGRAEHFAGQVAAALKTNSSELIVKGWEQGVVANISNSTVLSSKQPATNYTHAQEASYIVLHAQAGKEKALEQLLTGAAEIIVQTEPNTLMWASLKLNDNTFAIFDTFTDEAARATHISGKVASTLKDQAEDLIVGGWENGVLSNVHHYKVVAEAGK